MIILSVHKVAQVQGEMMSSISFRNPFIVGVALCLLSIARPCYSQKAQTIGIEVQGYPSGVISVLRGGFEINPRQEFALRAGYNIARRGDSGKHDKEKGEGAGFGFNYRYYFHHNLDGFFLGARADLWFLTIDWNDRQPFECPPTVICAESGNSVIQGSSDVTVLQPTAEIGYNLLRGRSSWLVAPTASFGWEINVHTSGEDVGEGAIFLAGLNVAYLF